MRRILQGERRLNSWLYFEAISLLDMFFKSEENWYHSFRVLVGVIYGGAV